MKTMVQIGLDFGFDSDVIELLSQIDTALDNDDDAEVRRIEAQIESEYPSEWDQLTDFMEEDMDIQLGRK